jgi:hypothetical protein
LRASPTGADIVSRICQLVSARDDEHAFAVAARRSSRCCWCWCARCAREVGLARRYAVTARVAAL